ncbi:hypothetical protein RB608_22415 [Nocardioides sp. LHD-245]|uniref:hypothetical protein n=1 Tax=Nocardioides sp. LHD-245 TaxID=3051387 RepID=UPI0027E045A4|nr:hypothetical protein [Nocardioides sp. LHD-245]
MSTDVEHLIATAFEAGYDDEPAPRTADGYVAAGRRRARQRRLRVTAAVVGVVGAVAVAGALVAGGAGPVRSTPDRTPVAQSPSPTAGATPAPAPDPAPTQRISDVLSPGQHVGYDGRGAVVLRPGWRIVREIPNPLHRVAPEASVGLVVTKGTASFWYLLDHSPDGGSASWDPAGKAYQRFEQWLDVMVDLDRGEEPEPYVRFAGEGDLLEAGVGVRILRQWADPDVPGFAAPGDDTAVAKVAADGRVYFVLARRSPGGPTDTLPVDAGVLPAPTLAAFLAHARDRYASGEGLR